MLIQRVVRIPTRIFTFGLLTHRYYNQRQAFLSPTKLFTTSTYKKKRWGRHSTESIQLMYPKAIMCSTGFQLFSSPPSPFFLLPRESGSSFPKKLFSRSPAPSLYIIADRYILLLCQKKCTTPRSTAITERRPLLNVNPIMGFQTSRCEDTQVRLSQSD